MSSHVWAGSSRHRLGDRLFAGTTRAAGLAILLALVGVVVFLALESLPALKAGAVDLRGHAHLVGYLWPLVFGTVLAAALAMLIATPLSIGLALAVSHFTPRPLGRAIGYVVDLLAAVPSVVYGLWGIGVLGPSLVPAVPLARRAPVLAAVLQWPDVADRAHDPDRGDRARDHGAPDRHRDRPGDLRADPHPPGGGRARPGRNPLGDGARSQCSPTRAPASCRR